MRIPPGISQGVKYTFQKIPAHLYNSWAMSHASQLEMSNAVEECRFVGVFMEEDYLQLPGRWVTGMSFLLRTPSAQQRLWSHLPG